MGGLAEKIQFRFGRVPSFRVDPSSRVERTSCRIKGKNCS